MNTEINKKYVTIDIDKYQEITGCNETFDNSWKWDEDNGLEITANRQGYMFKFNIVDHHKFFLAQIKYGL